MKAFIYSGLLTVGLLGASLWAASPQGTCPAGGCSTTTQPAATTQPTAVNKYCPVQRDNPVDPKITLNYNGQIIGFCCEDCVKEFKAHPDKYLANLK